MNCKHCNAPLKDGEKFCSACGKPVEETVVKKSNPCLLSGLLLSIFSFLAGIVLLTIALVNRVWVGIDMLVFLPACAAVVLNVFGLNKAKEAGDAGGKLLALVALILSGVILLYGFIACCVLTA